VFLTGVWKYPDALSFLRIIPNDLEGGPINPYARARRQI